MTEPLPDVAANIVGLPYTDIVADRFTYSLGIDRYAFGYWAEKVGEPDTYLVQDIDVINAYRYSPFLISHNCNTSATIAGCCMISENQGGVCLMMEGSGASIKTYRFTFAQWLGVLASFNGTQNGYISQFSGKEQITGGTPATKLDWMDSYHCEGSNYQHVCTAYQPDWENDQE